jgi:hypothetical protein
MKSLSNPQDAAEIRTRILALTAEDQPQWGVMNVTQMVCHVREPYLFALSPGPYAQIKLPISPKAAKFMALRSPLPWPKGLPTLPELKIGGARMDTTTFAADHAALLEAFDRFCAAPSIIRDHPFFTTMTHADWMRWGYLHPDHHLRQFGR